MAALQFSKSCTLFQQAWRKAQLFDSYRKEVLREAPKHFRKTNPGVLAAAERLFFGRNPRNDP